MQRLIDQVDAILVDADFFQGYLECAVWSSTDDDGNPLDGIDAELSANARAKMLADCIRFTSENAALLDAGSECRG